MAKRYFKPEPWSVTEARYQPHRNALLESIFSLGNGYMGVRGTPEEGFSGEGSFPATYVACVYDLIPTGTDRHVTYVSHCSVMVEATNGFGVELALGGSRFDPRGGKLLAYRRSLDLKAGTLVRTLTWRDGRGRTTELAFTRFVSLADRHVGAVRVAVRPLNWSGRARFVCALDARGAARQRDLRSGAAGRDGALLVTETPATRFATATAMRLRVTRGGRAAAAKMALVRKGKYVAREVSLEIRQGETCCVDKLVAVCSSRDGRRRGAGERALAKAAACRRDGFETLLARHAAAWGRVWADNDVRITGDRAAQQGIRFCIFQMHQSYAGTDARVNIPAKGLSGPGYGGLYWWDTEAYMMPFFLYTAPAKARMLIRYRYRTLTGARNKARRFGYDGAMFPWVTIHGEECSGDWEYGMCEQHVTAAVAHGVWHYVQATQDEQFLWDCGAEILIETARFWASRVNYSRRKKAYVIHFVTGPDEYAVGVNNNYYTNFMARWNLEYGLEVVRRMKTAAPREWKALARRLGFRDAELARWRDVARKMYLPYDEELGIPEQDDAFLDRDPFDVRSTPAADLPAGTWLWERLQRSQAMKQPDVLMLMHMHNDRFTAAQKLAAYRFYEPKTTHESSLSRCVHAIIAAEVGLDEDAFRYYHSSARLDLDDVNGNTHQGLHAACLAGSWLSVVTGFGGMRLVKGRLCFRPRLPRRWKRLAFAVVFRGRRVRVTMERDRTLFELDGRPLTVTVDGEKAKLAGGAATVVAAVGRARRAVRAGDSRRA